MRETARKIIEIVTAYQGHSPVRDLGVDPETDLERQIFEELWSLIRARQELLQ